ncbi:hypothetical protein KN815_16130 [Streptomyces sp. 4503]|uniref:Protein kilB n=1 Tax=Streptomyces niphimycinicus TaxID=2842201 RepID=A0ABS6CF45_9ACTN|nr:hypothetical protein [Streptomyces niphimycinicus]MBU3865550.1 hypothetical protein [Streptomyces niphimycinicus]
METTIVAVAGTLLGAIVAGGMQHLVSLSARRDRDRQTRTDAVARLLGNAADHRREQYLKHVARRGGQTDTHETRRVRYEARTAMTKALASVQLSGANEDLVALAADLVTASTALGDAPSEDRAAVDTAGDTARRAHAALLDAAVRTL